MPFKNSMLKVIDLRGCGFVPSNVAIIQATWHKYRERLEEVLLKHPRLFPGFRKGAIDFDDFGMHRRGNTVVDEWGCVWTFKIDGLEGQVVKHRARAVPEDKGGWSKGLPAYRRARDGGCGRLD